MKVLDCWREISAKEKIRSAIALLEDATATLEAIDDVKIKNRALQSADSLLAQWELRQI